MEDAEGRQELTTRLVVSDSGSSNPVDADVVAEIQEDEQSDSGVPQFLVVQRVKLQPIQPLSASEIEAETNAVASCGREVWMPDVFEVWFNSPNSYLDGAEPRQVVAREGRARVLEALDHVDAGGFS